MNETYKLKNCNSMFELYTTFLGYLKVRVPVGQPLIVHFEEQGLPVYCYSRLLPSKPGIKIPNSRVASCATRKITTFVQLLQEPFRRTLEQCIGTHTLTLANMPCFVTYACRIAAVLLKQLDCRNDDLINASNCKLPNPVFSRVPYASNAHPLSLITIRNVDKMVELLQQKKSALGSNITKLRLVREKSIAQVEWLDRNETVFQKESLEAFLQSIIESLFEELKDECERMQAAASETFETGIKVLRESSPKFANAISSAYQGGCCESIRLCKTSRKRNVPLDVWFHINPNMGQNSQSICMLAVNRGHEDFVLVASDGHRYYLPPCLLSARVLFTHHGPKVLNPAVRQPRGGYMWAHPYTGPLRASDPFVNHAVEDYEIEIMYPPSEEAIVLFPQLSKGTLAVNEGYICIKDLQKMINSHQMTLQKIIMKNDSVDILSVFTSMHDVARMTLTRGHQKNSAGGMMKMAPQTMKYPLLGRPIHGILSKRVFGYIPPVAKLNPSSRMKTVRHNRIGVALGNPGVRLPTTHLGI